MSPQAIDTVFPYVCFLYGSVMTFVLNIPALVRIADERLPQNLAAQWKGHRALAFTCMLVGAAWTLQNLWLK
jgi:hypothetical protein